MLRNIRFNEKRDRTELYMVVYMETRVAFSVHLPFTIYVQLSF